MEDYRKDVPYIVYESEAARHERTVKRLLMALLITILLMVGTNECCEAEEYSNAMGGYSRRGGYSGRMSYADMSYADEPHMDYIRPDGSYRDGGMSYARGRGAGAKIDAMGRYSSEGGVDEHTKEELRKLIDKM